MGVSGLLRHCMDNARDVVTYGNLLQFVRDTGHSIEILVDFYSFISSMIDNVNRKLSAKWDDSFIGFLSAEYDMYHHFTIEYIHVLRSLGIELVFYVDGSRGSCSPTAKYKGQTWRTRAIEQYRRTMEVVNVCKNGEMLSNSRDHMVVPILGDTQMLESVHEAGSEVVYCCFGEADTKLSHDFLQRPHAFAVLSNDSDFCLMRGCVFIPDIFFDTTDELDMKGSCLFVKRPRKLIVGVIKPTEVASLLQLDSHEQLVDWAILRGNDFTGDFVRGLHQRWGLTSGRRSNCTNELSHMISCYGSLETIPEVSALLERDADFQQVVQYTRWFYSAHQNPDPELSSLGKLVYNQCKNGLFPMMFMGVHRGHYWHKITNEVVEFGSPSVEGALQGLRESMYTMLLDSPDWSVTEHGQILSEQLQSFPVEANPLNGLHLPNLFELGPMSLDKRIQIFHDVVGHLDENGPYFFAMFGLKMGFVCYGLRYLLTLDKSVSGLDLTKEEFVSITAATIVGCFQRGNISQGLSVSRSAPVRPNTRSMKLASWTQAIWLYLFGRLAKLLELSKLFPKPREVFSGTVFVSFFMCKNKGQHQPEPPNKSVLEMARDGAVADHLEILEAITAGITL